MSDAQESRKAEIGRRIRTFREEYGKSLNEFAEGIGISPDELAAYEEGTISPSLPMIEIISFYLEVPVPIILGLESAQEKENHKFDSEKIALILELRNKIIGATLRKERLDQEKSPEEVSEAAGISVDELTQIEMGEKNTPIEELELIADKLNLSVQAMQDQRGPVSKWMAQQDAHESFSQLSPVLQEFVGKPINHPYLELAQNLSELSVKKLRELAEGLLEITY